MLFVFFALLLGVADCGQVLFAHQALVERARSAARWGVRASLARPRADRQPGAVRANAGAGAKQTAGYLGMTAANVQVLYQPRHARTAPMTRSSRSSIVNFESHLFSPWARQVLMSPRPVLVSAPMAARPAATVRNHADILVFWPP